jgi:hypothetical protein
VGPVELSALKPGFAVALEENIVELSRRTASQRQEESIVLAREYEKNGARVASLNIREYAKRSG